MKHTTCNKVTRILNSDLVHNSELISCSTRSFIDLIEKNLLRFSEIICSFKIEMFFYCISIIVLPPYHVCFDLQRHGQQEQG